jgi:hypothetical protein
MENIPAASGGFRRPEEERHVFAIQIGDFVPFLEDMR